MTSWLPALLAGASVTAAGGLTGAPARRLTSLRLTSLRVPALPRTSRGGPSPGGSRRLLTPTSPVVAGTVCAVLLGLWALGPAAAMVLAGATVSVARALQARRLGQERARERRQAVEACGALAAELRAGRSPGVALSVAAEVACGPAREALSAAAQSAAWGADVSAALLAATTSPSAVPEVLRGMAACWQVCSQAGSGLAASVERLADGLRARQAQERAVRAALAGPRASATLLAGLPLAGIALAAGLGADPLHVLLHTRLGFGCLTVGLGLDAAGLWWTSRIVARAAR